MAKLKPKGKRGLTAVKRLGRNYKTGGFKAIEEKAYKKYHSKKIARKVAAKRYWDMVKAKRKKKR